LGLLWAAAIDGALERAHEQLLGHDQRDQQAKDEGAPFESAENQRIDRQPDEDRLPDLQVADRGHEQVEPGTRPSFVDKLKNCLIHGAFEV
jgi:hypothetical protein